MEHLYSFILITLLLDTVILFVLSKQKLLNSKIIYVKVCYNSILAYILLLLSHNTVLYIFQQKRLMSIFLYRKNYTIFSTAVYLVSDSYNLVEQVSNLYKLYTIVHLFYHLEISNPPWNYMKFSIVQDMSFYEHEHYQI